MKSEGSNSRDNSYCLSGSLQTVLGWRYIPVIVAILVLIPVGTVMLSFLSPAGEIWQHLVETTLSRLLLNSFWLALGVATSSAVLGVSLAWFTAVYDFPWPKNFLLGIITSACIPSICSGICYFRGCSILLVPYRHHYVLGLEQNHSGSQTLEAGWV